MGIDVRVEKRPFCSAEKSINAMPLFWVAQKRRTNKTQCAFSKEKKVDLKRDNAHRKIASQRKRFCHEEATKIVGQCQSVSTEDLAVKSTLEKVRYVKSTTDIFWHQFRRHLTHTIKNSDRWTMHFGPSYKIHKSWGEVHSKPLSQRQNFCKHCGHQANRDRTASQSMWALGIDGLGIAPKRSCL